jgi:hypothetical protein
MSRRLDGGSQGAEVPALPVPERGSDLGPFEGQWVAMREDRVIAHGPDEETVRGNAEVEATDLVFPVGEPPSGFYLINV